ncbi:FAD-dependent oxidoreductase [Paenibacillus humicola]|uniref:FAD-dependent oxidoreductase n=1 Tax=Paenibacillus humicola TaxID=3110540 RepID=UPI00237B1A26|nr:FAD-dependent oxidoreductase [Paenibacillus humicola]
MNLQIGKANIPVLGEADAAVLGGSLAGIACALELAKGGKRVWLVEPRTYMGRELTATLRPWLDAAEETQPLPDLIAHLINEQRAAGEGLSAFAAGSGRFTGEYIALYPDLLKRGLEDRLESAGVRFLYASLPVSIVLREGKAAGVVIANKSGRQLIDARLIVDATETSIACTLCGEDVSRFAPGSTAVYARTLEFVDADPEAGLPGEGAAVSGGYRRFGVPADIGVLNDEVRLRQGYRGGGHLYAEYALELPGANSLEASRDREIEARRRGMRLAVHLLQREPAFRKAVLASSSHELAGPYPLSGPRTDRIPPLPEPAAADVPGVYSLNKAFYRLGWAAPQGPVGAAAAGEHVGRLLAEASRLEGLSAADGPQPPEKGAAAGDRLLRAETAESPRAKPGKSFDTVCPAGADAASHDDQAVIRIPSPGSEETGPLAEVPASAVPVLASVGVLVAGGGSSGACASYTAAGEGVRTALVDLNPGLGGTGTFGGVDSYWFGRKAGFAARIQEAVLALQRELRYKGHKWSIEAKMHVLLEKAVNGGVELILNAVTFGVVMQGSRAKGAVVATCWGPKAVLAEAVVDATGDGDLAAFAGADFVYGSEKDHTVMWYSLAQYTSPDKIQNNFTSMVDVSNALDYTRAILAGRRRGTNTHDHGIYVATRESRHIKGDVVMKLTDQLLHRKWPDVINVHFSNHDVKGVSGADWVNIGLIPPNLEIEIPYRMLLPQGLDGMLVAGKAVSATHDALPAIRMQADLENLGAAAALAAVQAVCTGMPLRAVDLKRLQRRLAAEGLLAERTAERTLRPIRYRDGDLERLVESIEADKPLYEYSNMRMNEVYEGPIPFAEICSVGPRIVPFLERALGRADGLRRIRLAQALAMFGSNAGAPVLIEAILSELSGTELPSRSAEIMYVQLPPDHGAMPDAAYLLYSLAQTKDRRSIPVWERVAGLLKPDEDDFKDTWKGIYYYIDAVCQGAERLGDPDAVPALERLHRIPYLNGQQSGQGYQQDYFLERRAMLELAIGRAMAACGRPEGFETLIGYLADARSLLARQALLTLRRLSGMPFGKDPAAWREWLASAGPELQPRPLDIRLDLETNSESLLRQVEGTD